MITQKLSEKILNKRYLELDIIRASAIILMVIFHFFYDLSMYKYLDINTHSDTFWVYFRNLIIFLFMSSVGISLYIVNEREFNFKKNLKRLAKLFAVSALISIVSYVMYPKYWIYFGIIHLIFVSSIVGLLFVRLPWVALVVGVSIVTLNFFDLLSMTWLYDLTQSTLHLPMYTKDMAYFFPWVGVVCIGIFIGYKKYFDINLASTPLREKVAFLGQHALIIYLVHQPLMMGVMGAYHSLTQP